MLYIWQLKHTSHQNIVPWGAWDANHTISYMPLNQISTYGLIFIEKSEHERYFENLLCRKMLSYVGHFFQCLLLSITFIVLQIDDDIVHIFKAIYIAMNLVI